MSAYNNYITLARLDLKAAKLMLDGGMWNHCARLCQQYVEKCLKEFIFINGEAEDYYILSSHNLVQLAKKVSDISGINFSRDEVNWLRTLKDYYFDTNYPGDNYTELDDELSVEAYDWTVNFCSMYEEFLSTVLDNDNDSSDFTPSSSFN